MLDVVIVSGFARSGSSLMARIAATLTHMPLFGNETSGEDWDAAFDMEEEERWRRARGHVFKALDPTVASYGQPPAEWDARVIWMDRNPVVQAKSQERFMAVLFEVRSPAVAVSRLAASLRRDRPRALQQWSGLPLHRVQFGRLVSDPLPVLVDVCRFLGVPTGRAGRAALQVEIREGDVLRPTLLELEQMRSSG